MTKENLYDVAKWCNGDVRRDREGVRYIKVKVINPHDAMLKEADVGCWVLKSERGFKVYLDSAFKNGFVPVEVREEVST